MEGNRILEITLLSGKDLNKVNLVTKMDVYAVVTITGGHKTSNQIVKTSVDHDGDANPSWNFSMKFIVDESELKANLLVLDFKLICERVLGDKEVGDVRVPLKELSETTKGNVDGRIFVSYQVRKPDGNRKPKGQISFSYKFTGGGRHTTPSAARPSAPPYTPQVPEAVQHQQPLMYSNAPSSSSIYPPPVAQNYPPLDQYGKIGAEVYPPPQVGVYPPAEVYPPPHAGVYPPPMTPYGYSYSAPPSQGYPISTPLQWQGYAPQPQGYAYPPPGGYGPPPVVQPAQNRNNNLGLGLGAAGAGLLGGLLLGDLVSDLDGGGGFGF